MQALRQGVWPASRPLGARGGYAWLQNPSGTARPIARLWHRSRWPGPCRLALAGAGRQRFCDGGLHHRLGGAARHLPHERPQLWLDPGERQPWGPRHQGQVLRKGLPGLYTPVRLRWTNREAARHDFQDMERVHRLTSGTATPEDARVHQHLRPTGRNRGHHIARRTGLLRRSRYFGYAKTHLRHFATAAAMNLVRLVHWVSGDPLARTRHSRFSHLIRAKAANRLRQQCHVWCRRSNRDTGSASEQNVKRIHPGYRRIGAPSAPIIIGIPSILDAD
jgi:hypothetical protein